MVDDTGEGAVAGRSGLPLRASDAERAVAADRLHTALAEGRLDLAEAEERIAAVFASRLRSDLLPLLADLPAADPATPSTGWARL